jgi:hypothetical protein
MREGDTEKPPPSGQMQLYNNRIFSVYRKSDPGGGVCDPATNVEFFKPNLLYLTGAVAPRKEPAGVS